MMKKMESLKKSLLVKQIEHIRISPVIQTLGLISTLILIGMAKGIDEATLAYNSCRTWAELFIPSTKSGKYHNRLFLKAIIDHILFLLQTLGKNYYKYI
jgi:hypothetical protein